MGYLTINEWVEQARAAGRIKTNSDAAELLGISKTYLSLILSGKRLPGRATMEIIEARTGGAVTFQSWSKSGDA